VSFSLPVVFDGHNDVLLRLHSAGGVQSAASFVTGREGALDLTKCRDGGFAGGFFAVFVPSPSDPDLKFHEMTKATYNLALPDEIEWSDAISVVASQIAILRELERLGAVRICQNTADIRSAMASDKIAAVLHLEGAEAIDGDLHTLDLLYGAGLRSLGPVWSRPTRFGHGVPFRYPSTPNTGDGLTDLGKALVRRCNELRILVDLSHLNEAGFWDVANLSTAPLVATHSNAHAICPHARNLTDAQLRAIAESGGLVGLNFAVAFLREDGKMLSDVPISQMLKHLDHMINILGEDGVGLGSDYDGAVVPQELTDASGLPRLTAEMKQHGYDETLIAKLCHENWLRALEQTWES